MNRYYIDYEGCRHKVIATNMYEYLNAKYDQWCRILDIIRIKSGEREIEHVRDELKSCENSLEGDMDLWNNHRAEVYAEWCANDGWTEAEVDKNWAEHFDDLRKRIVELKNKLTIMEIDMYLKCRPERTVKAFFDKFSNYGPTFKNMLERRVRTELNIP